MAALDGYRKTSLGTRWGFAIVPSPSGSRSYAVMLPRRDARGGVRETLYRIAPEGRGQSGWRIDYSDYGLWCAVTRTVYRAPSQAAKALVSMQESGELAANF